MIIIDSVYVNYSGGKVLLDYLVDEVLARNLEVVFLFDYRFENLHKVPENRRFFLKGELGRLKFYIKNKHKIKKVFCFGNVPPPIKLKAFVVTYLHHGPFLTDKKTILNFDSCIKRFYINLNISNSNLFVVQTKTGAKQFVEQFKFNLKNVEVIPFYNPKRIFRISTVYKTNQFFYVSNDAPHKNHMRLLNVWERLFDNGYKLKLILTIKENGNSLVYKRVLDLINRGLLIENYWFDDIDELNKVYNESNYFIFPSLTESFGLGLIESVDTNCCILCSDLDYAHAVIAPNFVFNPYSEDDIYNSILQCLKDGKMIYPSKKKVNNEIEKLLNLIL
jgi:glycosyltransferase involved in cell wall biosynthesis